MVEISGTLPYGVSHKYIGVLGRQNPDIIISTLLTMSVYNIRIGTNLVHLESGSCRGGMTLLKMSHIVKTLCR